MMLPCPWLVLWLLPLQEASSPPAAPAGGGTPAQLPIYRFHCEYFMSSADDRVSARRRISSLYTRGLPENHVRFTDTTIATAAGAEDPYGEEVPLSYMNDFIYSPSGMMFLPGFFRDFPSGIEATWAKNLVWDTYMFETLGRDYLDQLELNQPLRPSRLTDSVAPLAGIGAFRNRDLELTRIGNSERNGKPCVLIQYQAFFNRFEMGFGSTKFQGLSHYWGTFWISLGDRQVEHATLQEHVSLQIHRPGQEPVPQQVFRIATLEKQDAP